MTDSLPCRLIAHVDLDQFQVAVERLRTPQLQGRPVIVGGTGDPTQPRTVVTCASYEARDLGVRAGMPLRAAHRKAPEATFLPVDLDTYAVASAQVMDTLRSFGHPVEVWGFDEAFIGILDPPSDVHAFAAEVIERVAQVTRLRCAVGLSDNKQRAKMATNEAKAQRTGDGPRIFVLDADNWMPVMGQRPTRDLWSVGAKTSARLADAGITTVAELADTDRAELIAMFGPHQGNWLNVLARGGGDALITAEPYVPKSHSKAETFSADVTDSDELHARLGEMAAALHRQIRDGGREVFRVAVTLRTSTFYTRTKSKKLPAPTLEFDDIEPPLHALLDRFATDPGTEGRPVRLLGVRYELTDP
ncbi:DNA polymerase IV [Williamsia sp. CHRR-6]|uniref:DNA polymerase IV n=1 Tax=Williamsia sp. CHRR-6 TaxID=2835871 RepID=UPI001BDB2E9E|nr:DNA polymerase IV [Williamsia sp. CHRR-6]MBT0565854.1 DNA polymerase IV [Williamsia sp. CHRR-6]